jgi:TonB family protein
VESLQPTAGILYQYSSAHHTQAVTLILLLSFALGSTVVQEQGCIESLAKPDYPPPARFSAIDGVVRVLFQVGPKGKIGIARSNGHPKLIDEVRYLVDRAPVNPDCRENFEVVYRFVLRDEKSDEPHTHVTFNSPNEFVVTANRSVMSCYLYSVDKASWVRQIFSKLRGKGRIPDRQVMECY